MRTHQLKTWPPLFEAVWDGSKPFEVRWDDRSYQQGDVVVLREFDNRGRCDCLDTGHDNDCRRYTGRTITATVGHVLTSTSPRGSQPGFRGNGYVVFALLDITRGGVGKDPGPQDAPDSSDAPSPVSDESLPCKPERPAATLTLAAGGELDGAWQPETSVCGGCAPPSPLSVVEVQRRARSRAALERLERHGNEHTPVVAPRVAYSSGGNQ